MDAAQLFEGITLLIDLAQRGEIDPWDVQVIDVIDRYLSKLILAESATQAAYEADLSQSGQAFLSASMLVLFKANTLVEIEPPETDLVPSNDLFEDEVKPGRRLALEQQLCRRPTALPPQKRRVTLNELIDQLQLMATALQLESKAATTTRKSHFRSKSRAPVQTLELAHAENLTEVARQLEQILNYHSHQFLKQEWLDLDQLVFWTQTTKLALMPVQKSNAYTSSSQHSMAEASADFLPDGMEESGSLSQLQPQDRVSVFWALLLLSAQSKVELSQEEFYQEIKIRTLRDAAPNDYL